MRTASITNVSMALMPKGTGGVGIGTMAPDAALSIKSPGQNAVLDLYGVSTNPVDYGVIQVSSSGGLTNPLSSNPCAATEWRRRERRAYVTDEHL